VAEALRRLEAFLAHRAGGTPIHLKLEN